MEFRYKLQVESFTFKLFRNISGCLLSSASENENWKYTITVTVCMKKGSFSNHFREEGSRERAGSINSCVQSSGIDDNFVYIFQSLPISYRLFHDQCGLHEHLKKIRSS